MRTMTICILLVSLLSAALAEEPRRPHDIRTPGLLRSGSVDPAKAPGDTCVLIGPASLAPVAIGTFQDAAGQPDWNGWTSEDWTAADTTEVTWHVSDYYAINGAFSAYCGDESLPSCGAGDPVGGYGAFWDKILKWGSTVADPGQDTHLTVAFTFDVDSEGGYDYAKLARELEYGGRTDLWQISGDTTGTVTVPVTYTSGEYFGDGGDEIGVWFVGRSDPGWDDEDCDYPSTGLWRLDDVTITADNGAGGTGPIDFEDGTLGGLEPAYPGAVGDFTHILSDLGDPDPCVINRTPQITFIDDGIVQPATGGTRAVTPERMYADGWAVTVTGGLTFDENNDLHNAALSPVIPWQDASHDGCRLEFGYMTDAFWFVERSAAFMEWYVRSTDGDAASIEEAPWQLPPYIYTGGPYYGRRSLDIGDRLVPGRTYVQVALAAKEIDTWVWTLHNPSPSPFYDNVRLESYAAGGPSISTPSSALPQDAFPEIGDIDTADLGRNHIRFDQARNISPTSHGHYRNGDSITIDVVPLRTGAALTGRPLFHYELQRNPLFDPFRSSGLPDSGTIVMDTTYTPTGTVVRDRFRVDLPDTGFLFPGDLLHYHFSAEDAVGGMDPLTSTLPADTDGWGGFDDDWDWPCAFTVRGLPTMTEDLLNPGHYVNPSLLLWDGADSEADGGWIRWKNILDNQPMWRGVTYDYFSAKAPSIGSGTGLGGRATVAQLGWYDELVLFTGAVSGATLSNGDWSSGGTDDLGLLAGWLDLGGKDLLMCGDELAAGLDGTAAGQAFLNDRLQVIFVDRSHRDLLGGQLAPRVLAAPSNPVLASASSWSAYGGCDELREFDLVTPNGSTRLALWAGPDGDDGGYPYSPMTLALHPNGSRVISMTMDLAHVRFDDLEGAKADATLATRSRIFSDVTSYFGIPNYPVQASPVPDGAAFSAVNHPNPFNPVTEIAYTVKAPGRLTVKIYNLRGQVVRTLLDRRVGQGGKVAWDGTDAQGGQAASGVYFYEARMGGEVEIGKMALIK